MREIYAQKSRNERDLRAKDHKRELHTKDHISELERSRPRHNRERIVQGKDFIYKKQTFLAV